MPQPVVRQGNSFGRETNFIDLYRLLDLQPGCELGEFKQAYRRRVAVLHPDRRKISHDNQDASEKLQHLTALYASAIEFERRHGRLPGALHARPTEAAVTDSMSSSAPMSFAIHQPADPRKLWAGIAIAVVALWLIWSPPWSTDNAESDASAEAAPANTDDGHQERGDTASAATIRIGTTADLVRTIEGEPLLINGNRWEYGPSWIYFQGDTVVDWYSSPLHPLETVSAHPQPTDK